MNNKENSQSSLRAQFLAGAAYGGGIGVCSTLFAVGFIMGIPSVGAGVGLAAMVGLLAVIGRGPELMARHKTGHIGTMSFFESKMHLAGRTLAYAAVTVPAIATAVHFMPKTMP